MSNFLKYLEKYDEKGNDVIFYLKDYPSSSLSGNKIVRELYIFLFHDEGLQLNRVHHVGGRMYKVEKEQKYHCLYCGTPIFFDTEAEIVMCDFCKWRNELDDTPAIHPITIKSKEHEENIIQICYPLIEEADLKYLPEGLREAVETYFKEPERFTKNMYENIYHNILKRDISKMVLQSKELTARIIFTRFFNDTKAFLKRI